MSCDINDSHLSATYITQETFNGRKVEKVVNTSYNRLSNIAEKTAMLTYKLVTS